MKPQEALSKRMSNNDNDNNDTIDLKATILGIVLCLLCLALPIALLWFHQMMRVTSGVGNF